MTEFFKSMIGDAVRVAIFYIVLALVVYGVGLLAHRYGLL